MDGAQRIAAATGVLMALHHLIVAQARQLLDRASDRTHRSLQQVADTVLHTGSLTEPRQHDTNTARHLVVSNGSVHEPAACRVSSDQGQDGQWR